MERSSDTIYLDHAATTPLRLEVFQAMLPHLTHTYGNPSSLHHRGRVAFDVLSRARAVVAGALDVSNSEVIFTGSGTEANNLALRGVAHAYRKQGTHILVSAIEHHSVLKTALQLSKEGFDVEYVPVDAQGLVSVEAVLARVRRDTIMVSIMYANNEIGTIEPIQELGEALSRIPNRIHKVFFHTDACQAVGQLDCSPAALGVDLMTMNSSKIYGPKGVGMLYVKNGIRLHPQTTGGEQEFGMRAGTENIPGIVGFAEALLIATKERAYESKRLTTIRDAYIRALNAAIPECSLNGHPSRRLPNNVHVSLPYVEGESLVLMLDASLICVATGSACTSHDLAPSHVLRAIGEDIDRIHGSLRLTLGKSNTLAQVPIVVQQVSEVYKKLRAVSVLPHVYAYGNK